MEAAKNLRFKKTVALSEILEGVWHSPFKYFEDWPILEVREKCLKEMERRRFFDSEWLEPCIRELLEGYDNYDFGKKMLSFYIFAERNEVVIRAIEFALSLWREGRAWEGELSKVIAGRLLKDKTKLYPKLPSLHGFLEDLLDKLMKKGQRDGYLASNWYCAERALRIIIAAEDFSFLPKIEELILLLQEGEIYPSKCDPPYTRDLNLAMLRATKRLLLKAKKEKLAEPE